MPPLHVTATRTAWDLSLSRCVLRTNRIHRRWAREALLPSGRTRAGRAGGDDPLPFATCTQYGGEVLFVPHGWAHGVLNHVAGLAIATELRDDPVQAGGPQPPGRAPLAASPMVAEALGVVAEANAASLGGDVARRADPVRAEHAAMRRRTRRLMEMLQP